MGRIASALGVLVVLVAAAAGFWTWAPLTSDFDADAAREAALAYDVEILRDTWGSPHIYGRTDADTSFGLAYAHAEDDFETIQLAVAAGRGRLARYKGAAAAPTDYLVALFDVWGTIERGYATTLAPEARALAEAYAVGLNLYATEHPAQTWTGLAPFTGEDVVAGFIFKTPFFYGLDHTLLGLFGDEHAQEVALDPGAGDEAFLVRPRRAIETGSNAFAVAPSRSPDNVTRLLINSHQPFTGPVAWYEAHLISEEGLDIFGGVFPGTPLILHGFNRHLGWANTVSKPDLADVYVLQRNPDNADEYRLDDAWVPFEASSTTIEVKLFGPFAFKATRPVLRTEHGPVIESEHGTYAVRYAGLGEVRQLEQYRQIGRARNLDEWIEAMSLLALPSINYIYADAEGNIAFVHNGQYPDRAPGWDWSGEMPGDRSDLIWQGYRDWSAVPKLINPQSGFIYNANNTPYLATDGPDNLRASQFPPEMGLQTNDTNRSLRIAELTDPRRRISAAALLAIKFDTSYSEHSVAASWRDQILAIDWSGDETLTAAATHLADWNLETDLDNRHAALGVLSTIDAVTEDITGIVPPSPEETFRRAVALLHDNHGRIDPTWSEVNRMVRGDVDMGVSGSADILRAIYPVEIRDDGHLHANAGDTWIALVEWDASGALEAEVIHQFGAATLDESSPHYDDQAPLFVRQEWRPVWMDRADVEAHLERRYRPGR